jgi:hypothetical protein
VGRSTSVEHRHHVGRFEHHRGNRGHQQPGVIVDHVQDLDLGAARELPVGDVGLPPFVGHRRLEAHERALGALLRLRADEAPARQHPPHRGDRRSLSVASAQVVGDRVGAGVEPFLGKLLSQADDLLLDLRGDPTPARPGPPRPGLKTVLTLGIEPADQLVDPPPGHPVVSGHPGLRAPFHPNGGDHELRQRHPTPP